MRVHLSLNKEMADDNQELTNCIVCFEFYTENGDHVPRLLPCHHTVCEKCIKQLLKKTAEVNCPECRKVYKNVNNVQEFQQNKYILSHIREKRREQQEKAAVKKHLCEEHGIELYFYCKDISCKKKLCPSCLLEHMNHHFIPLDQYCEEQRGKLMTDIEILTNNLLCNQQQLLKTKHKINADCEASVECARDKKNEYINVIEETFNKIIEDVTKQVQKVNRPIDDNLGDIDVCLVQLKSIKETINEPTIHSTEIDEKFETFREIEREVDKKTATVMSYTYPQYHDSNATTDDVERICGYLTETEVLPEMLRACSIEDGNGTPNLGQTTGSCKGNTTGQTIVSLMALGSIFKTIF